MVEASVFGSDITAMKDAVEIIESICYKFRMFGMPINGPTNTYCDNGSVCTNKTLPESTLIKKHHIIVYHIIREELAVFTVIFSKGHTSNNMSEVFTKTTELPRREENLDRFRY